MHRLPSLRRVAHAAIPALRNLPSVQHYPQQLHHYGSLATPESATDSSSKAAPTSVPPLNAVFEHYFGDLLTTLDVAPVKRPQMTGSLACALEDFPVSVVLVEDTRGTSGEEVTQEVRRAAVHVAVSLERATKLSVRAFLLQQVCAAWPDVMGGLEKLDLSLRLHLHPVAVEAESTSGEAQKICVDPLSSSSVEPPVTSSLFKEQDAPPVLWSCVAALYDPWQAQPSFLTLGSYDAVPECSGNVIGSVSGVVENTLKRVREDLRLRHSSALRDAVREARRYIAEVGEEFSDLVLKRRCLAAAHCANPGVLSLGALSSSLRRCGRLARPRWRLQCYLDIDKRLGLAVGLHLLLIHYTYVEPRCCRGAEGGDQRTSLLKILQTSRVSRGLVPLLGEKPSAGSTRRAYWNPDCASEGLQDLYVVAEVENTVRCDPVAGSTESLRGPLDLAGQLVREAAVLSCSVAYDWVGAVRCADYDASRNERRSSRRCSTSAGKLPTCVRWSSLVGRAQLDAFLYDQQSECRTSSRNGDTECVRLPPLWPQTSYLHIGTEQARRAALRELLRHERGLRSLPRAMVMVPASPQLKLEYDAELTLLVDAAAGENTSKKGILMDTIAIEVDSERYADVAVAASVYTPWALPLCSVIATAQQTRGSICPHRRHVQRTSSASKQQCGRASASRHDHHRHNRTPNSSETTAMEVLCLTECLKAAGITAAKWDAHRRGLICARRKGGETVAVFKKLDTVSGYARLLRYSRKIPLFTTARVPRGARAAQLLSSLRESIGSCSTKKRENRCEGNPTRDEAVVHHDRAQFREVSLADADEVSCYGDDYHHIRMPLPFRMGAVVLTFRSPLAKEVAAQELLAIVQKEPPDLQPTSALLDCRPRSSVTLLDFWPLSRTWVAGPCPALYASLKPFPHSIGSTSGPVSSASCGAHLQNSAMLSPQSYQLLLRAASSLRVGGTPQRESQLLTSMSTQIPGTAKFFPELYVAVREALMAFYPEASLVAMSTEGSALATHSDRDHRADVARAAPSSRLRTLLLRCISFSEVAEVLLFSVAPRCDTLELSRDFIAALYGKNFYFAKRNDGHEVCVDATREAAIVLLSNAEVSSASSSTHFPAVCTAVHQRFLEQALPSVATSMWAMRRLREHFSDAAKTMGRPGAALRCEFTCRWVRRPTGTVQATEGEPRASDWVPVFIAEAVQSSSSAPSRKQQTFCFQNVSLQPLTAEDGAPISSSSRISSREVMYRVEGRSAFEAVWRILRWSQNQLWQLRGVLAETVPTDGINLFTYPARFLEEAQEAVARMHGVSSVTHHYDMEQRCLVVKGLSQRDELPGRGDAPRVPSVRELRRERMPLTAVPERIIRLYDCWLAEPRAVLSSNHSPLSSPSSVSASSLVAPWSVCFNAVATCPIHELTLKVAAVLKCRVEDLNDLNSTKTGCEWNCSLALPLRLLGFSDDLHTATAAHPERKPPPVLYICTSDRLKRLAVRYAYTLLFLWVCTPFVVEGNLGMKWSVQYRRRAPLTQVPLLQPPSSLAGPSPRRSAVRIERREGKTSAERKSDATGIPPQVAPLQRALLQAAQAHMAAHLSLLMVHVDGRVELQLSQTFGLEVVYTGRARSADKLTETKVQLHRDMWKAPMWAPAQIWRAAINVLERLSTHSVSSSSSSDGATTGEDFPKTGVPQLVREWLTLPNLNSLQRGPSVRVKAFCVSFFRRYFGWRVCERADVNDMSLTCGESDVVVVESVAAVMQKGCCEGTPRSSSSGFRTRYGDQTVMRASLQLAQIVPNDSLLPLRLAQVLVEGKGATAQTALDTLWELCARRIRDTFGVLPSMTIAEADEAIYQFLLEAASPTRLSLA